MVHVLGDFENAPGGIHIVLGDRDLLAQRQHIEIGRRHVLRDSQRDNFLIVARGLQALVGGAQIVLREAPEIERVARIGGKAEAV